MKQSIVQIKRLLDNSKNRICNNITIIKRQLKKDRIKIIIVDENLGY